MDWIAAAQQGNPRAVARLITQVENRAADARTIVAALYALSLIHISEPTRPY